MIKKSALFAVVLMLTACIKPSENTIRLPDPSLLDDSESTQSESIRNEASKLLAVQDYDGLEKLAAKDQSIESPFASGLSPISLFYEAIAGTPNPANPVTFKQELDALTTWTQDRPDSVAAKIALADATSWSAWYARGGGYASTVTEDGWAIFNQKLKETDDLLESAEGKRQSYPHWYYVMERVGRGQSWSKDDFFKLTNEGTLLYPKSPELYSAAIIYLLPRWSGSNEEVVDYATKSADQLGGDEGDVLYARMAKAVWAYSFDTNVFTGTGFSWPRVNHGMEIICNRYPHSTIMMNYYCLFAYQAADHELAHILFNHLGDHFSQGVSSLNNRYMEGGPWYTRDDFEKARSWAQ